MDLVTLAQSVRVSDLPDVCARYGLRVVGRTKQGAMLAFDQIHLAESADQTPEQATAWERYVKTGETK